MVNATAGSFQIDVNRTMSMSVSRKGFFTDMTVKKNIYLCTRLMNASWDKAQTVMQDFSIDYPDVLFGKLSAGMKQRVSLAVPFIEDADLILLDEPSNHLDIDSLIHLRSTILARRDTGVSFLITSHVFSDLEKICDRIMFLKNGKLVNVSSKSALMETYGSLEEAYVTILKGK